MAGTVRTVCCWSCFSVARGRTSLNLGSGGMNGGLCEESQSPDEADEVGHDGQVPEHCSGSVDKSLAYQAVFVSIVLRT